MVFCFISALSQKPSKESLSLSNKAFLLLIITDGSPRWLFFSLRCIVGSSSLRTRQIIIGYFSSLLMALFLSEASLPFLASISQLICSRISRLIVYHFIFYICFGNTKWEIKTFPALLKKISTFFLVILPSSREIFLA